jgi:hypothetical protein
MTTATTARLIAALCTLTLLSESAPALAQDSLQPLGWDEQIKLPEAVDLNADPHIVEVTLEARVAMVTIAPGVPHQRPPRVERHAGTGESGRGTTLDG